MPHLPQQPAAGVSRRTVARATAAAGLAALFGAATGTARAATRLGPRTLDVSVPSAALGRSAPVRLILPSDFGTRPEKKYPVLYCCTARTTTTPRGPVRRTSRRSPPDAT